MVRRPPENTPFPPKFLHTRAAEIPWAWVAAIVIPVLLLAPAIWNGYPLLEYDTGGYLARWYEGYLVPSRSTVYGIYLHLGQGSYFWINLGFQALLTLWILQLTLRVLGMAQPLRLLAIAVLLILTTALPWLASMLLTDIFAGLAVLVAFHSRRAQRQALDHREDLAVSVYVIRGRDPQRDVRRSVRACAVSAG